jgi:hypothetical protein
VVGRETAGEEEMTRTEVNALVEQIRTMPQQEAESMLFAVLCGEYSAGYEEGHDDGYDELFECAQNYVDDGEDC